MGSCARPPFVPTWAWLLLVACHTTPAPAQTRPPPAPVVAAPAPVSEPPAPVIEPPALTLAEVRDALPELQAYVPIAPVEPPAWLAEVDVVWIRVGKVCRPIEIDRNDRDRGELEVCTAKLPDADVVCTSPLAVGLQLHQSALLQCSATFPNGNGMGMGKGDGKVTSIGSLVAADDGQLRYASTWDLSAGAEKLVWMRGECTPDSVTTLTRALAAEGLRDDALREALHQRHGVVGSSRRCFEYHGVRLQAHRSDALPRGEPGAEAREASGPQDCTIACPDTAGPLRRLNAVLTAQPFVRTAETTSVVVHRVRATCDASPAAGLPALAGRPCRDWLTNTARARREPP